MKIKELRDFLNKVPLEMDDYQLVNGEVAGFEDFYVRVDKPIIHLQIDEENHEFLLLHQSEEELEKILKEINGDTKGT